MNGSSGDVEESLLESHSTLMSLKGAFTSSSGVLLVAALALFAVLVDYPEVTATDAQVSQYYMWYMHVAIMIFVGFGFLMTFLRNYSYSAVGLNFLTSAVVILFAIVCLGAAQQGVWYGSGKSKILLDLPLLIDSNFAAGAAMISFGALLGKVTPTQIMWLLVLQVPLYTLNASLAAAFGALDVGGSITIHAFGAYYGLAATLVLSKPGSGSEHHKNSAIVSSDMTAMIGTLFLWLFWPSFNGALASNPADPHSHAQFFCVINTVVALLGACVAGFAASAAVHGKFDMVHVQNATLAGGVAVGSAANLHIAPAGALAVGVIAGTLSVVGYSFIGPSLEKGMGLRDTCGVHNLHGMPGVMGGLVAALAALTHSNKGYLLHDSGKQQFVYQLVALAVTLVLAMVGGAIAGFIVKAVRHPSQKALDVDNMFDDEVFWET